MLVECLALLQLLATQKATQAPVTPAIAPLDAVTLLVYELLGIRGYTPMAPGGRATSTTTGPACTAASAAPSTTSSTDGGTIGTPGSATYTNGRTTRVDDTVPLSDLLTERQRNELVRLALSTALPMWCSVCATGDAATTQRTIRTHGTPFTQRLQGTFTALEARGVFQHVLNP